MDDKLDLSYPGNTKRIYIRFYNVIPHPLLNNTKRIHNRNSIPYW